MGDHVAPVVGRAQLRWRRTLLPSGEVDDGHGVAAARHLALGVERQAEEVGGGRRGQADGEVGGPVRHPLEADPVGGGPAPTVPEDPLDCGAEGAGVHAGARLHLHLVAVGLAGADHGAVARGDRELPGGRGGRGGRGPTCRGGRRGRRDGPSRRTGRWGAASVRRGLAAAQERGGADEDNHEDCGPERHEREATAPVDRSREETGHPWMVARRGRAREGWAGSRPTGQPSAPDWRRAAILASS